MIVMLRKQDKIRSFTRFFFKRWQWFRSLLAYHTLFPSGILEIFVENRAHRWRRDRLPRIARYRHFPCRQSSHFVPTTTAAFSKPPANSPVWPAENWPGGSGNTKIFAEFGIPAVNWSVGHQHEYTEFETLDYKATLETVFENNMITKELVATCKG